METLFLSPPIAAATRIHSGGAPIDGSACGAAAQFLRRFPLRITLISIALLLPCFWHRTIQAGDLASHTYNAWLAQLIARGELPGLSIAHQSNNILFDLALLHLGNAFGLHAAERIAVCASVLIFFWGLFAFVSAISRRAAWTVFPLIAALAYGWTFSQGFFNYYIALGLAFWGLALLERGRGIERWLALVLVPLIWTAHPLGVALLFLAATYVLATPALIRATGRGAQWLFFAAALAGLGLAHFYFAHRFQSIFLPGSFVAYLRDFNGFDQLILYGARDRWIAYALTVLLAAVAVGHYCNRESNRESHSSYIETQPRSPASLQASFPAPALTRSRTWTMCLHLYLLALLAGKLLPWVVFLPTYSAPGGMLTERLSLVTAAFAACLFALVAAESPRLRRGLLGALSCTALIFFVFLYRDTAALDRMERQATTLAQSLPRGSRVVGIVDADPGSRILIHHMIDRACIARCFSYGNYEPSSREFRVRAAPGNPYVVSVWLASEEIRKGDYVVHQNETPIFAISRCQPDSTALCLRALQPGEPISPTSAFPP